MCFHGSQPLDFSAENPSEGAVILLQEKGLPTNPWGCFNMEIV